MQFIPHNNMARKKQQKFPILLYLFFARILTLENCRIKHKWDVNILQTEIVVYLKKVKTKKYSYTNDLG